MSSFVVLDSTNKIVDAVRDVLVCAVPNAIEVSDIFYSILLMNGWPECDLYYINGDLVTQGSASVNVQAQRKQHVDTLIEIAEQEQNRLLINEWDSFFYMTPHNMTTLNSAALLKTKFMYNEKAEVRVIEPQFVNSFLVRLMEHKNFVLSSLEESINAINVCENVIVMSTILEKFKREVDPLYGD